MNNQGFIMEHKSYNHYTRTNQ